MVRERLSGFYCTCVTHLKSLVVSPVSPLRTVVPNSGARPERMWWASTASKFFTTCSPTREDSRTHSHSFAPVLTWGGGEGREGGSEGGNSETRKNRREISAQDRMRVRGSHSLTASAAISLERCFAMATVAVDLEAGRRWPSSSSTDEHETATPSRVAGERGGYVQQGGYTQGGRYT